MRTFNVYGFNPDWRGPSLCVNGEKVELLDESDRWVFKYHDWVIKVGNQGMTEIDLWNNRIDEEDRWAFLPVIAHGDLLVGEREYAYVVQPLINPKREMGLTSSRARTRFRAILRKYFLDGDVHPNDWSSPKGTWRNASVDLCGDPVVFDYGTTY